LQINTESPMLLASGLEFEMKNIHITIGIYRLS
jgi:hypothetical protein